jgi:hypothetical protein
MKLVNETNVNIDKPPALDENHLAKEGIMITAGDLHGNATKLLYVLKRHGFINITDENYKKFVSIYNQNRMSNSIIQRFNTIVDSITATNDCAGATLCLIGDVLSDRGKCDYFTLALLGKLNSLNISYDIIISNHDLEFIESYELTKSFDKGRLMPEQRLSAINLQCFITMGIVKYEEVVNLYTMAYLPNLKILHYSYENRPAFYNHAAIDTYKVVDMANKLNEELEEGESPIIYDGSEAMLSSVIDQINKKFQIKYVSQNKISQLLKVYELSSAEINGQVEINSKTHPFAYAIWNRITQNLKRLKTIDFVQGHDLRSNDTQYNLDSLLGKALTHHAIGDYKVTYTRKISMKNDEQISELDRLDSPALSIESHEFNKYVPAFFLHGKRESEDFENAEDIFSPRKKRNI